MKLTKLFNINFTDLFKGAITAVISALLMTVYTMLNSGTMNFAWAFWKPSILAAFAAGIGYIIKNFFSNSKGQFAQAEPKPFYKP